MQIEHEIKVIPIDDNMQVEVQKLKTEGWELIPGVKPVAIYYVVRAAGKTQQPSAAGFGRLTIDDSKVLIIKPDGTLQ